MRLRAQCKSCTKHNKVSSRGVLLRRDLEERVGEVYYFRCTECGIENDIHVNDIFAVINDVFKYCFIGLGAILVLLGLFILGVVVVSTAFISSSNSNSNLFNKSKI